MDTSTNLTGFWDNENCEYCEGAIKEKQVTVHRHVNDGYAVFESVPAGVCTECGARYYAANILKRIDARLASPKSAEREMLVPVYAV